MSLVSDRMQECVMLDKSTPSDNYGGTNTTYTSGATFQAAITLNSSSGLKVADKMTEKSLYTVTTSKAITLKYYDVFKRKSDSKIFRVTSDGYDNYTPETSTLNMRQVTAEEFQI